jgi:oligoribonuclease (3'-5' exoribonuclease)
MQFWMGWMPGIKAHTGRSGLIEKVKASTTNEAEATAQMLAFLKAARSRWQVSNVWQFYLSG